MGRFPYSSFASLVFIAVALTLQSVQASDPELTKDFQVPAGINAADIDGTFFTSEALRNVMPNVASPFATVTTANLVAPAKAPFLAVDGLGVSMALLQFPPGTVNPPHTHPRGTELLFIIEGTLDVGLVDTTNKLFTNTLYKGDIFAFPKGLVHFQINNDKYKTVTALGGFSSSNAGLVRLPNTLFNTSAPISDKVLEISFGISGDVVKALRAQFT
ncbi:protein MpCupin7 [Marchantia polymorpha subsp. ruderalis]